MVLVFAMLSCTAFPVSASEITVEQMRAYLLEIGFPTNFINYKEDIEIAEMYSQMYGKTIRYIGTETVSMTEIVDSNIMPLGVIPEEDMILTITTVAHLEYISPNEMNRIKEIYVYVDYIWTQEKPFFTWKDAITVNWDYEVFSFKADSFVARDYKLTWGTPGVWLNTTTLNNPIELDQGGLGYYADLSFSESVMGMSVGAIQHKGTAQFILLPRTSPMYDKSGANVTSINVNYLHNKNPGLVSVQFQHKSGFGISADVIGLKDSVAKSTNYYYSYIW